MNSRSEYSFDKNIVDRFKSLLRYASETRPDHQIVSEDGENRADVHSFIVFPVSPFFRRHCSTVNPCKFQKEEGNFQKNMYLRFFF